MDNEETQTQNTDEEVSGESTDKSLDSLIDAGEGTQEDSQVSSKEEKKQRDFERAYFKEREENKKLKAQLEGGQSATVEKLPAQEDEALGVLKGLMRDVIREERETSMALQDVKEKPYFEIVENQVLQIAKTLPESLSDKERLDRAYDKAVADNLDTIIKTAREVGQEEGYKNRSFKQAQGGVRPTPSSNTLGKDDQQERYFRGELADDEYRELKASGTLEAWDKEQLGIQ